MRALVTRPTGKGEALTEALKALIDGAYHQAVIDIVAGPDGDKVKAAVVAPAPDMLIFVSGFAVEYFVQQPKVGDWLENNMMQVFAVGQSTAMRLQHHADIAVNTPSLETSEGLLQLDALQSEQLKGKKVVIIRGVGGRELLRQQLQSRGAAVEYWQLYQRHAKTGHGQQWLNQWQSWQIDTVVITSVDILTTIVENLPPCSQSWWQSLRWVVASDRIGQQAVSLGINPSQIYDAKGAADSAILAQVKRIIEK